LDKCGLKACPGADLPVRAAPPRALAGEDIGRDQSGLVNEQLFIGLARVHAARKTPQAKGEGPRGRCFTHDGRFPRKQSVPE